MLLFVLEALRPEERYCLEDKSVLEKLAGAILPVSIEPWRNVAKWLERPREL